MVASVIVIYMLPREGKFMYEYQKGGFWKHEDLLAPFNFPVYKSKAQIEQERDSVLRNFRPIFNFNTDIAVQRILEFENNFQEDWVRFSMAELDIGTKEAYNNDNRYKINRNFENEYLTYIKSLLQDIYKTGIIDISPIEDNGKILYNEITLVKDNMASNCMVSDLYTPKTAYELIFSELQKHLADEKSTLFRKYKSYFDHLSINNYLSINVIYDDEKSKTVSRGLINGISLTHGLIREGQGIISRGEFITDEKFLILESLRQEYEKNLGFMARQLVGIGKFILVFSTLLVIFLFLRSFRKEILGSNIRISFILLTMILMILVAGLILKYNLVSTYLIPFTILPIILKTFFDARLGLFVHIITILLVGFFVPNGFEFVFLNVIAGMVAVMSVTNVYRRSKLVITSMYVIITYSVVYMGIALVQEGNLSHISLKYFGWFGLNGILILVAYPLIYLFEKLFGFVSDATLLELSDTNQPLLRKLAEVAPGTFQHSLQVANLAEEAVYQTGGNALLVRAGALYHDIGKMEDPMYFIENLTTTSNPHDDLEFEESARIIIGHVSRGVELARRKKLPEVIVDFIRMHHGTSTVQYFYRSYLRKYPDSEIDVQKFSYPGPRPTSKETAIVMMSDSVEAASRSLKTINGDTLDRLVDGIINIQMSEGQYNDAQVTFKEISMIKEIFKRRLRNIYHVRISYP
jgi:putative nucleotidyltransferase with HDIG domain